MKVIIANVACLCLVSDMVGDFCLFFLLEHYATKETGVDMQLVNIGRRLISPDGLPSIPSMVHPLASQDNLNL